MHTHLSVESVETIMVLGISHHQSDVDVRAHMAWSVQEQRQYLLEIQRLEGVLECALVVTCNRCECVLLVSAGDQVNAWWQARLGVLRQHGYRYVGKEAFRHIVKTSCGLDAKIIGEPQILGQMKRAYSMAREVGTCRANLGMFFDHIMHHARQIRMRAALGEHAVSLAVLCYQAIRSYHPVERELHVVCVGAGKVIQSQVRLLTDRLRVRISLLCRDVAAQSAFASVYDIKVYDIADKSLLQTPVDVLISATSSHEALITKQDLVHQQACLCIDLAVPRDIATDVGQLRGCKLVHMDELQLHLADNLSKRRQAIEKANTLVKVAVEKFFATWQERLGGHLLRGFRQKVAVCCAQVVQNAVVYNAAGVAKVEIMGCVYRDLVTLLGDCFALYDIPAELWPSLSIVDVQEDDLGWDVDIYIYKLSRRLVHRPTCWLRQSLHMPQALAEDEVACS